MPTKAPNVVAIIQARMGSSRLPGKVLADLVGQPMLSHVLRRAARIPDVDRCLVATTTSENDQPIVDLCAELGVKCFRGHPTDVLDRYYRAAVEAEADVIVRITGDCPLLDPDVSQRTLSAFLESDPPVDFAANRLPDHRTFPIGLDTEVCSFDALQTAHAQASAPHQREHVMPFLYENPDRFRIQLVDAERDLSHLRWTVDTAEDLEFVRAVYRALAPDIDFGMAKVLALLDRRPDLLNINAQVEHRHLADIDPRFERADSPEEGA
ncbi:MAG: glycosyltransferase family protein [Anaerolineales bacterium]